MAVDAIASLLVKRWDWQTRLETIDANFLIKGAVVGGEAGQARHRAQLVAFRDAQNHSAEPLADAIECLLELVLRSTRAHLVAGTQLQPAQLGAGLTVAARALDARAQRLRRLWWGWRSCWRRCWPPPRLRSQS